MGRLYVKAHNVGGFLYVGFSYIQKCKPLLGWYDSNGLGFEFSTNM